METRNIKFVAYLRFRGVFPTKIERLAKGRAKYFFTMETAEWEKWKAEFDRSEFLRYAQCLDAVVDLAY